MPQEEDDDARRKGTPWLLFRLTFCMLGIGFAWAAQFARGASLFEDLGLSDDGVSLAFLAGPICGLLVQPIVGTLSDTTSTRCGRRRPWIAAGLGLVVASFLTLGDAYFFGASLGDHSQHARPRAIAIAVGAFWVLDFSQNAVQLPCRTLVSDVLVAEDVATGNAMFSFFDGIGKLVSYLLASTSLTYLPRENEPEFATDARNQFAVAALVAAVCVGVTVSCVSEPPPTTKKTEGRSLCQATTHAWALAFKVLLYDGVSRKSSSYELVAVRESVDELDYDPDRHKPLRTTQLKADQAFAKWSQKRSRSGDLHEDSSLDDTSLFAEEEKSSRAAASSAAARVPQEDDDDDDDTSAAAAETTRLAIHDDRRAVAAAVADVEPEDDDDDDEAAVALTTTTTTKTKKSEDLEVLRRMCLTELGLWYGLSAWQVWGALFVGKSVLMGAPAASASEPLAVARFEDGVMLFSLGLAGANLVSLLVAPAYPRLLRRVGARLLMTFSALFMALIMGALAAMPLFLTTAPPTGNSGFDLPWTRDARFALTVVFMTLLGVPWAAHMNIPFSVVGRAYQAAPELGLYMATMNSSLCVAQLLMTFSTAGLLWIAGDKVQLCFAAGALSGLFAAFHANRLAVPYDESDRASVTLPVACAGH